MADSEVAVPADQAVAEIEAKTEEAPKDDSVAAVEDDGTSTGDRKRKLEDLVPHDEENEASIKKLENSTEALNHNAALDETVSRDEDADTGVLVDGFGSTTAVTPTPATDLVNLGNSESADPKIGDCGDGNAEADAPEKNPDVEINGSAAAEAGKELQYSETMTVGNGEFPSSESVQTTEALHDDSGTTSWKIEVPNNKVGVLIGKSGETIRYLQVNSGAKIQITRDAEADPNSTTRPVELIGSLESISKAEKLIKDVIAEADAGGSPSLVARGFSTIQSGGEQFEIKVPNEKVGLIIGKGGETIKNLQTRSGARIQLIPQHLPEGDFSKERTVRITGDKKQIETAKEMIKEVMNQMPIKPSPLSGYNQQNYRPRGHTSVPHWGGRAAAPAQPNMGHDYHQRGNYPPQASQYPQPYGGYSQQAPRGNYNGPSWDQQPSAPGHNTPSVGGYDYYSQGAGNQASIPNPIPGPTGAPASYGQSQAPNYGPLGGSYGGQANPTQNYGHGYNEPRYDTQAPSQQFYVQQNMPGAYGQGNAPQSGYGQQPYAKSAYGMPQEGPPYGVAPRASSQPGDPAYQGGPAPASYASGIPTQPYPYSSNAATQSAHSYNHSYGPSSGAMDGYAQPQPAAYMQQHGGQTAAPAYGHGGQPVTSYSQPNTQTAGYVQYPSSQQGYVDPASGSVNYGYQGGSSDATYGAPPGSGYGAPPAGGQPGYAQQPSNAAGYYDQSAAAPHSGYSNHPINATGYTKSVSPQPQPQPQTQPQTQPGYGAQY